MRLRYPLLANLRARLVLLVLLAVIPALGVVLYTASIQRRDAEYQVQQNLFRFTKFSAANQKQATEATRQLLITLSDLPEIQTGDIPACNRLLSKLLSHYESYAEFGVVDTTGTVLCSAPLPRGRVSAADRAYYRLARITRNFAAGAGQIGQVTDKTTINLSYPVFDESGQVQGVVFAALALDRLAQLASEVKLPPGSLLTVIDRNGTILVRSSDSQAWVGKSMPAVPIIQRVLAQPEGMTEAEGVDGVKRLYAFTTLGNDSVNKHIHVMIGIPRAIAFADANDFLIQNLISLGVVTSLALTAAWFAADLFLIRKVKSLVYTTQQIRSGTLSARTEVSAELGELGELASALDEMAETLERREQERRQGEDERKQAAANLQQSEERYRYLTETIPQLVWATNPDGVLTDINQRWSDFTGLTLAEVQTRGWEAVIYADDVPALYQNWIAAQQSGGHYRAEGRMRRADGSYRWHLHEAIPLKNEQGQIIKWFGTATDIEAQKQLEHQRQDLLEREQTAREQAEAANQIKDEFLAVLSHELRSPLNPILGWAKLLRTGKLDTSRREYALETIERNANLQAQLIDDLLDISRILRGKLTLTISPIDLGTVIPAALETIRLAAEAKSLNVTFERIEDHDGQRSNQTQGLETMQLNQQPVNTSTISKLSFQVLGDAGRLQQVIWNLVSNAVKFTPAGGQITVELSSNQTHAHVQVRDTGKGINPELLPFVFDHFWQEDGATTRKFGGLGLGLAIVRQIVELHGGRVAVASQGEEQGATFTVQLPLAPSLLEPPTSTPSSEAIPDLSGIQILVVDDDADSREFTLFVLKQSNASVTGVSSGVEALSAVAESPPDLIISDIGMPQMDGYSLIQQIRALPPDRGGAVIAIALTAYAGESNQQRALSAGFQRHLAKPLAPAALIKTVASLITNPTA